MVFLKEPSNVISVIGFFTAIVYGSNVTSKPEDDLVISYANGIVWQQDVLNWPAGQPLNLTCFIRRRHKKDINWNENGDRRPDIYEQQEDLQGQYDLSWNCKYCQYSNTVNSVSGEKISVHPDMHSDPWSYEFSQGLQLTKFDPHDKYDTGKYVCRAVPKQSDLTGPKTEALTAEIHINIISDLPTCGDGFFRCPSNARHCIKIRFLCDGVPDCINSEDESQNQCGLGDPCKGKIRCDRGRCMDAKDCCDPHLNSSCPMVIPCCQSTIESNRRFYRKGMTDSHDMRLIHSTIYTIIGCVVAFLFILILVAVAICRFHMKRRWSFRYYTNSASTESESSIPAGGRIISSINIRPSRQNQRNRRSRQLSGIRGASRPHPPITLHDLDIYFSSLRNVDATSGNGGTTGGITYNINNGVQIVGAPPPYSQATETDGNSGQASNPTADLPPPYRAEDETQATREPRSDPVMEHAIPQEDHLNLGASIRRHVRRNRNLFSGHSNNRQGPTNNSHPDPRNEPREQDPLLAEVNNNSFDEGPVLNNLMENGEEDGNNNGDINGNSEMIDLHNRRIQEEREREAQSRERRTHQHREEIMLNEMQDIDISLIPPPHRQNIDDQEEYDEPDNDILSRVRGAFSLDHPQNELNLQINSCENQDVPVGEDSKDNNITNSSENETSVTIVEETPRNICVDRVDANLSDYLQQNENKNSNDDSEPSDNL